MNNDNNILERVQKVINLYLEQENSLNAIERHLQLLSEIKTEDDDKLTSSIETIRVHIKVLKTHTAYNQLIEDSLKKEQRKLKKRTTKIKRSREKAALLDDLNRGQRQVESSYKSMIDFCESIHKPKNSIANLLDGVQTKPKKRGRGRPKGSKNKPKT